MSTMNLCSDCERHVYEDEPTCPFCGSAEPREPIKAAWGGRLSRSAAYAARAAAVAGALGVGACYESHRLDSDATADASPRDAGRDAIVADTEVRDAVVDFGRDAEEDFGVLDTGVVDAGPDGRDSDADTPPYGGVFPDPRQRAVV